MSGNRTGKTGRAVRCAVATVACLRQGGPRLLVQLHGPLLEDLHLGLPLLDRLVGAAQSHSDVPPAVHGHHLKEPQEGCLKAQPQTMRGRATAKGGVHKREFASIFVWFQLVCSYYVFSANSKASCQRTRGPRRVRGAEADCRAPGCRARARGARVCDGEPGCHASAHRPKYTRT